MNDYEMNVWMKLRVYLILRTNLASQKIVKVIKVNCYDKINNQNYNKKENNG